MNNILKRFALSIVGGSIIGILGSEINAPFIIVGPLAFIFGVFVPAAVFPFKKEEKNEQNNSN